MTKKSISVIIKPNYIKNSKIEKLVLQAVSNSKINQTDLQRKDGAFDGQQ